MNLSSNIFVSAPSVKTNAHTFVISTLTFNHLYFHTNMIQFYKLMIIQRSVLRIQVAAQDAYLSHTWDKPWVSNVTRLAPWSFLLRVLCALSFVKFSFHHNLRIFGDNLDLNHVSQRTTPFVISCCENQRIRNRIQWTEYKKKVNAVNIGFPGAISQPNARDSNKQATLKESMRGLFLAFLFFCKSTYFHFHK